MMMVEHEEGVVMKGKRTKRQRPLSSLTLAITSSSDESGARFMASSSAVTSRDSTEEDEDMAKCLILLAQGQGQMRKPEALPVGPGTSGYGYECKTCQRSFSSFQALGGHRASHKKPKNEEKIAAVLNFGENCDFQFQPQQFNMYTTTTTLSLQIGKSNNKVHECSICSAEFSSGQALGGHMRRHRTFANPPTTAAAATAQVLKKPRNLLQLDLNLPAPEEESKFSFGSKEKLVVFSASSLVDCHY